MEKPVHNPQERRVSAEVLALQAVSWLATDSDLLGAFLNETGAEPGSLAAGVKQPAFLAAVLDFILAQDQRVLDCAAALETSPQKVTEARAFLPGGDVPNWT